MPEHYIPIFLYAILAAAFPAGKAGVLGTNFTLSGDRHRRRTEFSAQTRRATLGNDGPSCAGGMDRPVAQRGKAGRLPA